jgi:hypothetical protein
MRIVPKSDTTTIVLVGMFQPQMYHPLWFEQHKAMSKGEAEQANISVVHPEITHFTTAKFWVQVEPNRFMAASTEYPEATLDVIMTVFGGPLLGLPINAMGINRGVHFDVGSTEAQHAIGRKLAPLDAWGAWGKEIAKHGHESQTRGGLLSLQMQQLRAKGPAGHTLVKVEPSNIVRGTGIFVEVNNHYNLVEASGRPNDADKMVSILQSEWTRANETSEKIIDQLMSLKVDEE